VRVSLGPLLVDAVDPAVVARFWEAVLGPEAAHQHLRFRRERTPKTVKNRVHLDIYVRDVESMLNLGARVPAEYPPTRVTLADVEDNEFCAFLDPDSPAGGRCPQPTGPPARLFAVCTDSDRPAGLAAWWASLVGADIGDGPDGTPRYLYRPRGWEHLIWKFVPVVDRRVVPNRWQWTLRANPSELGMSVDPQGNEFSVVPPACPAG
jgi:hypothetical protein